MERRDEGLEIIYEDDDIVVINKQPYFAMHRVSESDEKFTVADALVARDAAIARVGEDPLRPGIVHRLDADTSGVIIAAKNQKTFVWLKKQFAGRHVEKKYLAIVEGRMKETKGIMHNAIGRVNGKFRVINPAALRRSDTVPQKLREAETEFRAIRRFTDATLVLLAPKTGRTHQLRVQLADLGYPILGDKLYGTKNARQRAPRQMLHALALTVSMPGGKHLSFEAEPPPDFQEVLDELAKSSEEEHISKGEMNISYE